MTVASRPFPEPVAPGYEDLVDALHNGRLAARRCTTCGATQWPPRPLCGACHSGGFEPLPIDPVGTVYTFTVVHRAFHPWFAGRVPYGVAVVETGAGVRFTGLFDPAHLDRLACGLKVVGDVENLGGHPGLMWRPVDGGRS